MILDLRVEPQEYSFTHVFLIIPSNSSDYFLVQMLYVSYTHFLFLCKEFLCMNAIFVVKFNGCCCQGLSC